MCVLMGCAGDDSPGSGCASCEIKNLEGSCVPNLRGCDDPRPYIGYYGEDPGVFEPVDASRGVYLDGGSFDVPASSERTQCTYVVLSPEADFILGRYEARMSAGSHHFNMMRFDPGTLEAAGIELGVPQDCVNVGVPIYVAGSEWHYVDAPLSNGLGEKIPAGSGLVMEVHYVNTTAEQLRGRVEVNLFRRDASEVEHYIGLYFNVMQGFEISPRSTGTFRARCPAAEGANVVLLTSHMHRFGRRFTISLFDDVAGTNEPLYESLTYDHPVIQQRTDQPLVIGPNQGFEWSCEYENFLDEPLREGEMGLTNEMCIMVAYYYDERGGLPYCFQPASAF